MMQGFKQGWSFGLGRLLGRGVLVKLKQVKGLRVGAAALSMLFACSIFAPTALGLTSEFRTPYAIGEGTVFYAIDGENSSGLQKVNYVEYQPNTNISPVIAYGKGFYGRSTINHVADYLEGLGKEVIAGINGDFFDLTTGVPIGLVIKDGVFISSNVNQYAVGFRADGGAVVGKPVTAMTMSGPNGTTTVECFNKTRSTYTVCLYDSNFGGETKISTPGKNILLEKLEAGPVTVNSSMRLQVVSIQNASTSTPVGENQMLLTVSENGPLERIGHFAVGDEVTFSLTTNDTSWQEVVYALGGKNLINDGVIETGGNPTGLAARSAVGVKADGTVILYEVDGRQQSYSVGMQPKTLAEELLALGCVNAINLDGGGSSAMIIQYPGEQKSKIINKPSDGTPRTCANYIMLVNNAPPTGNLGRLHVYPKTKYVLKGGNVPLELKATDASYYPVAAPTDVSYSVEGSMGAVENGVFRAGQQTGTAVIHADSSGVQGKGQVFIISAISSFSILKGGSAITSLSAKPGEVIQLGAAATYKGNGVGVDNKSFSWKLEGSIGSISQDGIYTPGGTSPKGKILLGYEGKTIAIPVTISMGIGEEATLVADFEDSQPFSTLSGTLLQAVSGFEAVHNDKKALRVTYDFSQNASDVLAIASTPTGGNSYLSLWLKTADPTIGLVANFYGANDQVFDVPFTLKQGVTEYQQATVQIPAGATAFAGITLKQGTTQKGSFYLDQLVFSKNGGDALFPQISFTKVTEAIASGEIGSVIAKVTDNNGGVTMAEAGITVFVDGNKTAFTANKTNGNVSFNTKALKGGAHPVTIQAVDSFGNRAQKSITIQVAPAEGEAAGVFRDLSKHWAKDTIEFVAAKGVLKGEVDKKGNNLFYPQRSLTRAEFAVIMARYLGLDTTQEVVLPYADLAKIPDWALDAVKAVYAQGIMTGSEINGKTFFDPKANILRQEVMTVISKALPAGYQIKSQSFGDASSIPAWAKAHINHLVTMGIIKGYSDGTILPKNKMTRAEIAKVIYSLY